MYGFRFREWYSRPMVIITMAAPRFGRFEHYLLVIFVAVRSSAFPSAVINS
jgi:hypothetical protein